VGEFRPAVIGDELLDDVFASGFCEPGEFAPDVFEAHGWLWGFALLLVRGVGGGLWCWWVFGAWAGELVYVGVA
ncbi:hypothetical protein CYJ76_11930, partial [Kytococcus schroeteri]